MAGRVPTWEEGDPEPSPSPTPAAPQSQRGAAGQATPTPGATVSPGSNSGFVTGNQTPHRPSPTVVTHTAGYAGGDGTYGSPRPVGLPQNVAMDELQPGVTPQVMSPQLEQYLAGLADHMGHNRTPNSVWQNAVKIAGREGVSVMSVVYRMADEAGFRAGPGEQPPADDPAGPRGPSGPSGYSGPKATFTQTSEANLRDLADQIGMEMLGEGVSDEQFARILKRVRAVEAKNPQVTTSNGAGVSTTQQGVTDSDRQDVIENILARNPQYGDYQKATTMMDWFGNALNARLQNA